MMSWKFETQGCQWPGVKRIKSIFTDKQNVEQALAHLYITSSSSNVWNKTDLEKYHISGKQKPVWESYYLNCMGCQRW